MIIETRWFSFQGPRRADLSGRPLGFRFIWKPRPGPMRWIPNFRNPGPDGTPVECGGFWIEDGPRFGPIPRVREFGLCLPPPWLHDLLGKVRSKKYEELEAVQFVDHASGIPNDWHQWPDTYRQVAQSAVMRAVAERPGTKIVAHKSFCDRRIDLSGQPLQLYLAITLMRRTA